MALASGSEEEAGIVARADATHSPDAVLLAGACMTISTVARYPDGAENRLSRGRPIMADDIPSDWRDQFIVAINEKLEHPRICAACGKREISASSEVITPMIWTEGVVSSAFSYPMAMLICGNCGYTTCYNLLSLGIIPPDPQTSEGDDDDD